MSELNDEILKNLNEKGRLDCSSAFKLAKKFALEPKELANIANDMQIKIDNCELGQFGSLPKDEADVEILHKLEFKLDDKRRIFCKDARELAKGVGLKKIRSTLKEYKIDVKYCELGCFKEKKGKTMVVKTKTWIENADGELLFGKGKTEILETISKVGSIKKASEILDMNYKKCHNHLKILQNNLKEDLFNSKQGGGEDAGTTLNERAYELINAYKQLQDDIEEFANKRFKELFLKKK